MFSTFDSSSSIPLELQLTLQAQHVQYATVAFATVWVWDLLITIPEELSLISGAFLTVPNLAYTIARIVTFSYQIVSAMFTVISASTVNCHTLLHAAAWLLALSTPCNALLFLVRIRGVFLHSPKIVWTFTALWSTTFASFLIPLNYIGGQVLLANQNCLVEETRPWAVIGFITILIFDTAVFVAISTKVLTVNMANTWEERARIFFGRRHLGRLSKVLLHSGQQFYLVTIGVHLMMIIALLIPGIPSPYRGVLTIVTATFHNMMACRVFKLLKFGVIDDVPSCAVQTQSQLPDFMSLDSSFTQTNLNHT